jgi:FAD/FMN-containing dehydrogenase
MSAESVSADRALIDGLRKLVGGRLIAPGDEGYDAARTVFYGGMDRRPAIIVKVANARDVSRLVPFARDRGFELAVRSGGHSNAGYSVTEGGIVLDLGDMRSLQIDAPQRTAWAQPGLTAGEYTLAAHAHGLATGFGDTGSVGIGGLTLGGGIGYLVRKYGLTIDDLLAAEIVTADGRQLQLNAESNPDLFWAIRGGGGNFGVLTRLQFRLHELKRIHGGMLVLPATPQVIAAFVAAAQAAPDELSTIATVMPAPPMPFLASEHHGKMILMVMLAYAGAGAPAESAVAPFRALATPLADMLKTMPYPEIYPPEPEGYHPIAAGRNMFVDRIDEAAAELILERLKLSTAVFSVVQLRPLGGAMARVPVEATAFAHRKSRIMLHVAALYEKQEEKAVHEAWAEASMNALRQADQGAYVNFLGDEGPARVRLTYPSPTWERLAAIKRKHDPTNLFRLNQNIPPA